MTCKYCDRAFRTFPGLRQHHRQAHPVDYNADCEAEAASKGSKARWTDAETSVMAKSESKYKGLNLNAHLAKKIGKSLEAIKGKRRQPQYRLLVAEFTLARNTRSSSSSSSDISGSDSGPNRTTWSVVETTRMALDKAKSSGGNNNKFLADKCCRSQEAVKSKRRQKAYKVLVARLRAEREEHPDSKSGTDQPLITVHEQSASPAGCSLLL